MVVILLILVVAVVVWLVSASHGATAVRFPGSGRPTAARTSAPRTVAPLPVSRPARGTGLVFRSVAGEGGPVPLTKVSAALAGLRDAVTGASLDPARSLFRCRKCEVFYHQDSVALLREANGGRCASCQATDIVPFRSVQVPAAPAHPWQAASCSLVDYRKKVGQVTVFEGRCVRVLQSRRGDDYAVMFDHGSWKSGFKMVALRGAIDQVGGAAFLQSLAGRRLKVRGLIVKHPIFSYQIIVTDRSMILEVRA